MPLPKTKPQQPKNPANQKNAGLLSADDVRTADRRRSVAWRCRCWTRQLLVLLTAGWRRRLKDQLCNQIRNEFSRLGFSQPAFLCLSSPARLAQGVMTQVHRAWIRYSRRRPRGGGDISVLPNQATGDSVLGESRQGGAWPNQQGLLIVDIYCHTRCATP